MNIREIRKALKLSQTQLGHRLGVHGGTVSSWESGRAIPPQKYLDTIREMAEAEGVLAADKEQVKPVVRVPAPKITSGIKPYVPRKRAKLYVDDSLLYRKRQ